MSARQQPGSLRLYAKQVMLAIAALRTDRIAGSVLAVALAVLGTLVRPASALAADPSAQTRSAERLPGQSGAQVPDNGGRDAAGAASAKLSTGVAVLSGDVSS